MLRRGAGSGILIGAFLCAIGAGLSVLGSRQHGPGGAQAIYVGVVVLGAVRILVALIPQRQARKRQEAHPQAPTPYTSGAPQLTGAPYVPGAHHSTGAPYVTGAPHPTGAPAPAPAPPSPVGYTPVRSAPGRCWDCGGRVRLDSAICFHCGAAQVNGYQRATGRPASSTASGPAPMDTQGSTEYPRYEPARPY